MSLPALPPELYREILKTLIDRFPYPISMDAPGDWLVNPWDKDDRFYDELDNDWGDASVFYPSSALFLHDGKIISINAVDFSFTEITNDLLRAVAQKYIYDIRRYTGYEIPSPSRLAGDFKMMLYELQRDFNSIDYEYTPTTTEFAPKFRKPYALSKVLYFNAWNMLRIAKNFELKNLKKIFSVFDNLQSKHERDWLIRAIAYKLQNPFKKGHFIIFYGKQGTGKTALAELCGRILGSYQQVSEQIINGRFASWLKGGHLLTIVNEYYFTNANINQFKDLITNTNVVIEEKFRTPYIAKNYSWFILTTNSVEGLRVSEKSDRISLLTSFERKVRHTDNEKHITDWINNEEIEQFRAYLNKLDVKILKPYAKEIEMIAEENLYTPVVALLLKRLREDLIDYTNDSVKTDDEGAVYIASEWFANTINALRANSDMPDLHQPLIKIKREFRKYIDFLLPGTQKVALGREYFQGVRKRTFIIPENVFNIPSEKLTSDNNDFEEKIPDEPF